MKVAFLGDIALFGVYSKKNNNFLLSQIAEISNYLQRFDLVVGNLESPFSQNKKTKGAKSAYVCSDIENVEILKILNIGVVTLANNHMFDYGTEGYSTTIETLNKAGIHWFGTEGKTLEIVKENNRLLFSGYCCYSTNPLRLIENNRSVGVNTYNVETIKKDLIFAKNNGYLPILAAHVGLEHVNYPSLDHIRAARQFADVCPYLYYGHHPHVIQGVEEYKGALIAHSLGNFCFDDVYANPTDKEPLIKLSEQNRTGMILEVDIDNNQVVDWKEQMIYIGRDGVLSLLADDGRLFEYNKELACCEDFLDEYICRRKEILDAILAQRKSMRNFTWILKRLRPRYLKLFLDMRKNAKLYQKNVKQYLS